MTEGPVIRASMPAPRPPLARRARLAPYAVRSLRRQVRDFEVLRGRAVKSLRAQAGHDLRIALRRFRLLLEFYGPALHAPPEGTLRRLAALDDELSRIRDIDTLRLVLHDVGRGREVQLDRVLLQERRAVASRARDALRRFPMEGPRPKAPGVSARGRLMMTAALAGLLRPFYARVRSRSKKARLDPTEQNLHGVRIALRRLRYAVEDVESLAPKSARRLLRRLRPTGSLLSDHQDLAAARSRLVRIATDARRPILPLERFEMGHLAARLERRQRRGLAELHRELGRGHKKAWRRLLEDLTAGRNAKDARSG